MISDESQKIGFTCAYAPLPLISAAGFSPYRILPVGDPPDQAGRWLHDNLCPHAKKVLDRALAADIPDLSGVVFMNSCDAMRRLADAWHRVRPEHKVCLVDLPCAADDGSVDYFAQELHGLGQFLERWSGRAVTADAIGEAIEDYNELAGLLATLRDRRAGGLLKLRGREVQELCNLAATEPVGLVTNRLREVLSEPESDSPAVGGVPIFIFGNVLAEPAAFDLFDSCGVTVVDDDLCTGSRQFCSVDGGPGDDPIPRLARGLLHRPACARTIDPRVPGGLARTVVERARSAKAKGVIAHVAKFCDPYLARLPLVREALRDAGIALLVLEGDCTMRSIGQQRTRIEAFAEMLG